MQETEQEKEILTAQFTDISRQKAVLDGEQKELVSTRERLQGEIADFAHLQQVAKVRVCIGSKTSGLNSGTKDKIEQAVDIRTASVSDVNGWKKKLEDEEAKVKEANETAEFFEREFQVGHSSTLLVGQEVTVSFA